jgi:hypothetical protein
MAVFARKVKEDVCELEELVCIRTYNVDLDSHGRSQVHVMHNGLVVLCSQAGRFSLYETRERVEKRENDNLWADFLRGVWTDKVPQDVGQFFCRDLETGRRSVRELIRRNGRLQDVSGGFVGHGKVTEYRGQWFVPRIPPLKGSY